MGSKLYSPAVEHLLQVTHSLGRCSKFENHWRSSVAHGSQVPETLQQSDRSQLLFDYQIEFLPTVHQLCLQRDEVEKDVVISNCVYFHCIINDCCITFVVLHQY